MIRGKYPNQFNQTPRTMTAAQAEKVVSQARKLGMIYPSEVAAQNTKEGVAAQPNNSAMDAIALIEDLLLYASTGKKNLWPWLKKNNARLCAVIAQQHQ